MPLKKNKNSNSKNDRNKISGTSVNTINDEPQHQESNNIFEPVNKESETTKRTSKEEVNESNEYLGTFQVYMNENFDFEIPSEFEIPRTRNRSRKRKRSSSAKRNSSRSRKRRK